MFKKRQAKADAKKARIEAAKADYKAQVDAETVRLVPLFKEYLAAKRGLQAKVDECRARARSAGGDGSRNGGRHGKSRLRYSPHPRQLRGDHCMKLNLNLKASLATAALILAFMALAPTAAASPVCITGISDYPPCVDVHRSRPHHVI